MTTDKMTAVLELVLISDTQIYVILSKKINKKSLLLVLAVSSLANDARYFSENPTVHNPVIFPSFKDFSQTVFEMYLRWLADWL